MQICRVPKLHLSKNLFRVKVRIMVYSTDGSSHRDGVQNEHNTIEMINYNPKCQRIYDVTGKLEHRGGTRNHADAVNERGEGVSIKTKTTDEGSFDFKNTSLASLSDADYILYFLKKHKQMKEEYGFMYDNLPIMDLEAKHQLTENVRAEYKQLSHEILTRIDYKSVLEKVYNTHDSKWVIYHSTRQKKVILFGKEELLRLWSEPGQLLINDDSASATIENTCGLRIRIALNNGVKALLGRGSWLTVKIQQDNPRELMDALENPIVCEY